MMWSLHVTLRVALALLLVGCGTLSVEDEKQLGHRVQRQVHAEFQLLRDPVIVNYVREIGGEMSARKTPGPFEFRFYGVEDESLNAFAIPGGAIYIHTGLISSAKSEAELAGVLAHEMGHVSARHTARLYRRGRNTGLVAQLVTILLAILSGNSAVAQGGALVTDMAAATYMNTYSQDAEREADALAIDTLVRAGFDPNALITMFQTLQADAAGGLAMPQFLRSHPAPAQRMTNVQRLIRSHEPLPPNLRTVDRKLPIIHERIKLVVGTDTNSEWEVK